MHFSYSLTRLRNWRKREVAAGEAARGAVLARLAAGAYHHGCVSALRRETHGFGQETETVAIVSFAGAGGARVPSFAGAGGARVPFLVSEADTHDVDGGMIAGLAGVRVAALLPASGLFRDRLPAAARALVERCMDPVERRPAVGADAELVELVDYYFGHAEACGCFGHQGLRLASTHDAGRLAAALGIGAAHAGAAVRAALLVANVGGRGLGHWEALEKVHAFRPGVATSMFESSDDGSLCLWRGFYASDNDQHIRDGPMPVKPCGGAAVAAFPALSRPREGTGAAYPQQLEARGKYMEPGDSPRDVRRVLLVLLRRRLARPGALSSLPRLLATLNGLRKIVRVRLEIMEYEDRPHCWGGDEAAAAAKWASFHVRIDGLEAEALRNSEPDEDEIYDYYWDEEGRYDRAAVEDWTFGHLLHYEGRLRGPPHSL